MPRLAQTVDTGAKHARGYNASVPEANPNTVAADGIVYWLFPMDGPVRAHRASCGSVLIQ
jgi:hypothetical protein